MGARIWRCGDRSFDLRTPLVMGIVNATPDSFSDGGRYPDASSAIAEGRAMVAGGAGIVDVGGESTRPGSDPVDVQGELERVLPVVRGLVGEGIPVSIDSRKAEVARACEREGAVVLNDVSGFGDPEMIELAAASSAGLVVMHMLGDPRTMQDAPAYRDVVGEVRDHLDGRARALRLAGVDPARIAVDPGIGFGKTLEHNLELLRGIPALRALGYPVLIGVSRKRFIGAVTGIDEPARRLAGSIAAALFAVARGADIVRVHDVPETVQALAMAEALEPHSAGEGDA